MQLVDDLLIVGNGPSIEEIAPNRIDAFPGVILRLNNFVSSSSAGSRYEIYGSSMWLDIEPRSIQTDVEIWCTRPYLRYDRSQRCEDLFGRRPDYALSGEDYSALLAELEGTQPSTGLTCVVMARALINRFDSIHLVGFDFFEGQRQHYFSHQPVRTVHAPQREKLFLQRMERVHILKEPPDSWRQSTV